VHAASSNGRGLAVLRFCKAAEAKSFCLRLFLLPIFFAVIISFVATNLFRACLRCGASAVRHAAVVEIPAAASVPSPAVRALFEISAVPNAVPVVPIVVPVVASPSVELSLSVVALQDPGTRMARFARAKRQLSTNEEKLRHQVGLNQFVRYELTQWFQDIKGVLHMRADCGGPHVARRPWAPDQEPEYCKTCQGETCPCCSVPLCAKTCIRSLNCSHWFHESCFWPLCAADVDLLCPLCREVYYFPDTLLPRLYCYWESHQAPGANKSEAAFLERLGKKSHSEKLLLSLSR